MWKVYRSRQLSTIIVLFLHPMLLYRIVPKEKQNFVHIFVFVFVKPEKTSKNYIIMNNFMQRRFYGFFCQLVGDTTRSWWHF
jgi:hypothetical protein